MMGAIDPTLASQLALGVYAVNAGEDRRVKAFLSNKAFSQGASQRQFSADVGGRVFHAANDVFGVCAMGAGHYQGDLFVVFRGTTQANSKADWITDARIGITRSKTALPVHIGFNHAFNSALPEIKTFLAQAKITGSIHCIGHSLGGAVASVAADWFSQNLPHEVKLYSFGAPRVGTDWFVKSTTTSIGSQNIYRAYHRTDPVAMVPLFPFMHAAYGDHGHFIYSAQPLASGVAHSMQGYVQSVVGKSWGELKSNPLQLYSIEKEIESWLRSKSPIDSSSSTFWLWVESALIYVLKKVALSAILALQGAFIGLFTLADKIAYLLAKGIELADHISIWVEMLMRKLMQALGMATAKNKSDLTRTLIRQVLLRVTEKAHRDARNAIRKV